MPEQLGGHTAEDPVEAALLRGETRVSCTNNLGGKGCGFPTHTRSLTVYRVINSKVLKFRIESLLLVGLFTGLGLGAQGCKAQGAEAWVCMVQEPSRV